jgi:predicted nucleic acid-binding protein
LKFWDSSAIVPLLVDEATTTTLRSLASPDADQVVWWVTATECASALTRRRRLGQIDTSGYDSAIVRLTDIRNRWTEIPPSAELREEAERLLRTYPLRAADAFQLSAALRTASGAPEPVPFVCLDDRLCDAARGEGFIVEP